jgi:nitrite reductase/ring-hydroxylating ferredoxin subunit
MGDCIMCLSHGWTFDLATSKSARPKTDLALKSYTVTVVSDDIYLELS